LNNVEKQKLIFISKSPSEIIKGLNVRKSVFFTNTGARDTPQSDFKNRFTLFDLMKLAPIYNKTGYFSVEVHGGARFHQNLLNNKIDPYEEVKKWKEVLTDTLTQTLIRSTNLWGYRAYPENVIRFSIRAFIKYVDVWRCFDFLNYIPNMIPVAEEVLKSHKIFEPCIVFSNSEYATDRYYLGVVEEIVKVCGGTEEIILCIKDMAGVGSPSRIRTLVNTIKDRFPDLIIQYHRHSTDGLAIPSMLEAVRAGVKILDVTDDAFSRFYGHPPVRPIVALLKENNFDVNIDDELLSDASDIIRRFVRKYERFESPYRGFSYDVIQHRMPGGAFPSSFEQAEKGGFLNLMPYILKGMSYGNRIIRYFDVTPGSQITWTTWAGIIQRLHKEGGEGEIERVLNILNKFTNGKMSFNELPPDERDTLLKIYSNATDDLKNLILGRYGPLPFGWPEPWVYESVFGKNWEEIVKKERIENMGTSALPNEDINIQWHNLEKEIGRTPTEEELILYLQHPKATVSFIKFREKYGNTSILPTEIWFNGFKNPGEKVTITIEGKPHEIQLVSISEETNNTKYIVIAVDNVITVFPVEMPGAKKDISEKKRMADPSKIGEISSMVKGVVWRIGDKNRRVKIGDMVKKGQEIMNIEVMKTENAVISPVNGIIKEICVDINESVEAGQLLAIIEPVYSKRN